MSVTASLAHSTIETILRDRPGAAPILMRNGMACVGCPMARFETLAEAAREYHLDLASLLAQLRAGRPAKDRRPVGRRSLPGAGP